MIKNKLRIQEMNKTHLLRVYPSIIRVNSSNFDPIPHWLLGTQMVALNFQTYDRAMELNRALFDRNGRYGYVMKPSELSVNPPRQLFITILSAQQIQRAETNDDFRAEVSFEIIGHELDSVRTRTEVTRSNGFNPIWKESFEYPIHYPELCFLRFEINDLESKMGVSPYLFGSFTILLSSLSQGTFVIYSRIPPFATEQQAWR